MARRRERRHVVKVKCLGCGRPHSGIGRLGRRRLYCGKCHSEELLAKWRRRSAGERDYPQETA